MIEKKKDKIFIYIISSFVLIAGVIYTASIIIGLESSQHKVTIENSLNQINLFYSLITSLATISCITCYTSTKKDELYFTFVLFLVFLVDIIFGNIDRFYFDGNVFSIHSNILIPNSFVRSAILIIMLFNFKKLNSYIMKNKVKFVLVVFLLSTFLGICEILKIFDSDNIFNMNTMFYNFFIVILYFAVGIKYFIIGIQKNEYINIILSSSMFFFGLRWGFIVYSTISDYVYLELVSMSVTLIGFITFIGGVICELLITINKNEKLEKKLIIFKQIAEESKNTGIAIFHKNNKLLHINDFGKLYLCDSSDVSYSEVEKVLSKKCNMYLDKSIFTNISSQLQKYDFWSGSVPIKEDDIVLDCSLQKIKFEEENLFVLTFQDISQRVRENRYLAEYKSYKEQEKFRNEFFANISHELRTPLNIFYSTLQLLDKKIDDDSDFKEVYKSRRKSLIVNSYRMLRLINNIVDISKMDAGFTKPKFTNVDIVRIVEEITMSVVDYAKLKNIDVLFDTQIEECIIKCDPNMIERIILNLLSNSIKFTDKNGKIFVDIFINSGFVQIRVKDNGIGIPIDMQDKIFDRFVQSDKSLTRKNEGSGIGLSIVSSMVKLNNGEIYLESDGENGTEFEILLPNICIEEEVKEDYFVSKNQIELELSDIYELQ